MANLKGGSIVADYLILNAGNHYSLEHHDDVAITSIADGEILTWDNSNLYWKNETLTEAGILGLSGGTLTGNLIFNDNIHAYFGTGSDLNIYHNGTNSFIYNSTGALDIGNTTSNTLYFRTNNTYRWGIQAGGDLIPITDSTYNIGADAYRILTGYFDNVDISLKLGLEDDGGIYMRGTNDPAHRIYFASGDAKNIWLYNNTISVRYYNAGTPAEVLNIGTNGNLNLLNHLSLVDSKAAYFGTSSDLQIYHDGTNSYVYNTNGILYVGTSSANYLTFRTSGTSRFYIDATTGHFIPSTDSTYDIGTSSVRPANAYFDAVYSPSVTNDLASNMTVGTTVSGWNLVLRAGTSTRWAISGATGDLVPEANQTYDVGQSNARVAYVYTAYVSLPDSGHLYVGTGNDLDIYHDGTYSYIKDLSAGGLKFQAPAYLFTCGTKTLAMNTDGDWLPGTDSAQDLGTDAVRWANVYADTFTGALSGNATTATTLATARAINGVNFDGSSGITVPINIQENDTADTTTYPVLVGGSATGNQTAVTNSTLLSFNGTTGEFKASNFNASMGTFYSATNINMYADVGAKFTITTNAVARWDVDTSGHLVPQLDSAYTIGLTGTRPSYIYTDNLDTPKIGNLTSNGFVKTSGSDGTLSVDTSTYITSSGVTYENLSANSDIGNGSSQVAVGNHTHKYEYSHSYTVPDAEDGDLIGFAVPVMSGTTVKITRVRYWTSAGTCTLAINKNGTGLTGFTSMSASSTAATTDASDQTLADLDVINCTVSSASSLGDLTVSIIFEITVAVYS